MKAMTRAGGASPAPTVPGTGARFVTSGGRTTCVAVRTGWRKREGREGQAPPLRHPARGTIRDERRQDDVHGGPNEVA